MDRKHANIGATVSLLLNIHKLVGAAAELPMSLADLFTAESHGCDYKILTDREDLCSFKDLNSKVPCKVGNCPLGVEVDKIAKEQDFPTITEHSLTLPADTKKKCGFDVGKGYKDIDRGVYSFGADPDRLMLYRQNTTGSHIHVGYTGWRKLWQEFKQRFVFGWPAFFVDWVKQIITDWKWYSVVVLIILAVNFGSQLLGTYWPN